jgi:beta-1,4-mannooligosaccharide/beta-1,4-mannosyl-N-acetylglucosamine phosphorylase
LLLYHGVSGYQGETEKRVRYCAGAAVLDLDDPTKVLYRSPRPVLEPSLPHETAGIVPSVVFPTATDLRENNRLDVYYGGADSVVAAARLTIPPQLPVTSG